MLNDYGGFDRVRHGLSRFYCRWTSQADRRFPIESSFRVLMFQESFFSSCFNDGKNIIYVSLEKDRSIGNMQSAEGLFFEVFHEDLCKNGRYEQSLEVTLFTLETTGLRGTPASYIGEAGNTLAHRYQEHVKALTRYRNAVNRLNIPTHYEDATDTEPHEAMEQAAETSAIAQHAAHSTGQLHAKVLCRESIYD
ncbi:hypothetical protein M514_04415 [Trichuris suis]|uniref:Uncharacterized protein n=1 Tax=Trichuris suis TaxID=68888 RepID=A0A085MZ63_9BILA|nr:hypothetical protein M513_04415 [Trichuris suis]KFD62509.1 hypothetical protein M514_04415 [Trichuris suis]